MASATRNTDVFLDAMDDVMNDFIDRVLELCIQSLIDDGKVDTAQLIKTANVNRGYLVKQLVFPVNYASIVNYGRQANSQMPPPDALENWVRRKLGVPSKDVKRVAFAIAKSIAERGIQPTFFLENSVETARSEFGL